MRGNASRKARGHVVESHQGLINRRGKRKRRFRNLPSRARAFHPTPRPTYEIQTRAPPPPLTPLRAGHYFHTSRFALPRYNVMYITYYVICINLR